jgi:hypothetical protein
VFLTQKQIVDLTGLNRPSAQAKWLSSRGWRFDTRADGKLVVLEAEAQRHLCGGSPQRRRTTPDLGALQ